MRTIIVPCLLGLVSALLGCTEAEQVEEPDPVPLEKVDTAALMKIKPPSELALLMRDMVAHVDSSKARMERSAMPLPYPEQFEKIFTATPTDGKLPIDKFSFTAFADSYLERVRAFHGSPDEDRRMTFNAMVDACAACHQSACPGPLVKIRKMYSPVL